MKKIICLLLLLGSLVATPKYELDVLGPGNATSINDLREVAGYNEEMGFFYSDEKGIISFGEIYKTLPFITNDSRVFFTDRFFTGIFQYETIKPSFWSLETSVVHLETPNWKIPFYDVSYINYVSKSGNVIIGDHWDPLQASEQFLLEGSDSGKLYRIGYSVNDGGWFCGSFRDWTWNRYQTSVVLTTDGNRVSFKDVVDVWLTLNNFNQAAGFKIFQGKLVGIHNSYNIHFNDFYFRRLNDNDVAIASSTNDLDTDEYLYDFNVRKAYKIAELVDDQSIEILYIFDINTNGDLCGVGLQGDETVAIRLRKVR